MKNTTKSKIGVDAIAEARKHPEFATYEESAAVRIRFGIEIYNTREQKDITQQTLAKMVKTTQKVISNVENGDVNIGIELLNRIGQRLDFNAENWSRVFDFKVPVTQYILDTSTGRSTSEELIDFIENNLNYNLTVKQ